MAIKETQFLQFFQRLLKIDLFGVDGPPIPYPSPVTVPNVQAAIESGAVMLPNPFQEAYITPLKDRLPNVLAQLQGDDGTLETLAGAAYEHTQPDFAPQVRRFLAVISDLYRSFLSSKRRARAEFPMVQTLPPLAMFQRDGGNGPFTVPCDTIQQLTGGTVGVVSMPATYRDHPVLWGSLAHETGGHDVLHADHSLLPELQEGVRSFLGGGAPGANRTLSQPQLLGLLWSYWMDEAASDVYGVLNIGPSFGHNLAVYFGALNAAATNGTAPTLRAQSGFDPSDPQKALDPHPTDLLRLHLILGAVESMDGLTQAKRDDYAADLEILSEICGKGATNVDISGVIQGGPGVHIPVETSVPMTVMQTAARRVGSYIATTKLKALGGHRIQEIETWDDADEDTASRISDALVADRPVSGLGDDAQLLAGATLALFNSPGQYDEVTKLMNDALNLSFAQDPYWIKPQPDRVIQRNSSMSLAKSGLDLYTVTRPTVKTKMGTKKRVTTGE